VKWIVAGLAAAVLIGVPAWLAKREMDRRRFRAKVEREEQIRRAAGMSC
jgi:hypothetical protein